MFRLWCHSFDCRFAQKKRILRFDVFQIKSAKVFRKGESKGLIKGKKRWWYSKSVIGGCHCLEVQNFCIIYQVYNKSSAIKIVKEQSYMERKNIHINFSGSICLVKCILVSYRYDMILFCLDHTFFTWKFWGKISQSYPYSDLRRSKQTIKRQKTKYHLREVTITRLCMVL